jgi:hypothetical protein
MIAEWLKLAMKDLVVSPEEAIHVPEPSNKIKGFTGK